MKKTLAIVLCLLLSLCVLSACGDEPAVDPANPGTNVEGNAAEEGEEAHVLTDSAGYTIEAGLGTNPLPISDFDGIYRECLPIMVYLATFQPWKFCRA